MSPILHVLFSPLFSPSPPAPPLTGCCCFFQVCDFIQRRDGHRADPDNIFLTNGASEAVRLVLRTAIRGPSDGVMVPVPQVRAFQRSLLSVELTDSRIIL